MKTELLRMKCSKIGLMAVLVFAPALMTGIVWAAAQCVAYSTADCPQNLPGYANCIAVSDSGGTSYMTLTNAVDEGGVTNSPAAHTGVCTYEGTGCPQADHSQPYYWGNTYSACP